MIELKSKREIQLIREGGEILKKVFAAVKPMVAEGITTDHIIAQILQENASLEHVYLVCFGAFACEVYSATLRLCLLNGRGQP